MTKIHNKRQWNSQCNLSVEKSGYLFSVCENLQLSYLGSTNKVLLLTTGSCYWCPIGIILWSVRPWFETVKCDLTDLETVYYDAKLCWQKNSGSTRIRIVEGFWQGKMHGGGDKTSWHNLQILAFFWGGGGGGDSLQSRMGKMLYIYIYTFPLEPEPAMSIFVYDPFWHSFNFLLYVVSLPNGLKVGVDIASSGSKGTMFALMLPLAIKTCLTLAIKNFKYELLRGHNWILLAHRP